MEVDFLVIGSGLAGLNYALNIGESSPDRKIVLVTKNNEDESNTKYAQGGVAIVHNDTDSFKKHIKDTLISGDGLCNQSIVEMVIKEGPSCLSELMNYGVNFDTNDDGELDLGKEGGHTENRVAHFQDITGLEIERKLLLELSKLKNVTLLAHHFAVDLITEHHIKNSQNKEVNCYGAFVLDESSNEILMIQSKITLLASGGIGQVYEHTTNPKIATGDGIAMAYRAKAAIQDVEFVQFHPTALYQIDETPAFLISEAVRGFGAKLRTADGQLFMHKYDEREELASRDIVARAIDKELKERGDNYVYLDCTSLDSVLFKKHFPNITSKCLEIGIDPFIKMIPVVPAQHYLCGGVSTNEWGETSVKNLFACGECSRTGLHGANRLASNSLLEAFVFSKRSAVRSSELIAKIEINNNISIWDSKGTSEPEELVLISHNREEVQKIMWDYVGIIRTNKRLHRANERLRLIYEETEELYKRSTISPQLCELRNLITVAYIIIQFSLKRTSNKGGFYNVDLVS